MSWVKIYDISWFFLFLRRYVGQTRKRGSYLYAKKIRNKNVLICILIYRHSKRSCYTNRVMMTTWPGHLIKRLFTIKKYSKKIYICQNNLIASVIVETGGAAWCEFVSQIYILTTDSDILSKEFFPHMHFSADSF